MQVCIRRRIGRGNILGTPGSAALTLSLGTMGLGANQTTVNYQMNIPSGHPNIGEDFALRIRVENLGTDDGVASPNGTNDFTQANFDNARVSFVPEPSSALLTALAMVALGGVARRRK